MGETTGAGRSGTSASSTDSAASVVLVGLELSQLLLLLPLYADDAIVVVGVTASYGTEYTTRS